MKQQNFEKISWKHRYSHGGILLQKRRGRKARPLSTKATIHVVLKANKTFIRGGFRTKRRFQLIHFISKKYAKYFWVKIDQMSIQADHIHLLVRTSRRAKYLDFFRVLAGQIAQRFEKEGLFVVQSTGVTDTPDNSAMRKEVDVNQNGFCVKRPMKLWMYRPFTRVVAGGWKALKTVWNYVQLNEQEALGKIKYRKERLKGLSLADWEILWS